MIEVQQIVISYYRQGKSQRAIARELGVHRRTVKRYIDLYESDQSKQKLSSTGIVQEPKYNSSKRKRIKLTDEVKVFIDACLAKNESKSKQGLHKQKMRSIDIYEALKSSEQDIGYTTVCNYVRSQKRINKEKFIKQFYDPGSLIEFDWGWVKLFIGGKLVRLKMAVFTSAYSNHRYARIFMREDMCSFLEAHTHYLNYIDGVPLCFLYDNMKVAVAKFTIKQSDKKPTNDLLKISSYYQFDFRFTNAGKGNEKGHVERSVEYVRRKAFSITDHFDSLESANDYLQEKVKELNCKVSKGERQTIQERFEQERKVLKQLPISVYQTAILTTCKLDKYNTICVDTNHYSVPESVQSNLVEVKKYSDQIHIYDDRSNKIAVHPRRYAKHQWFINLDHYLFTLKTKPGALTCSYALKQAPDVLKKLFENHYQDKPKIFIEIALFCKEHKISILDWQEATEQYSKQTTNGITAQTIIFILQQITQTNSNKYDKTEDKSPLSQEITHSANQQLKQIQNIFN